MSDALTVKYKCPCFSAERDVSVRYRRDGEDAVEWMEDVVGEAIGADHLRRSPLCTRRTMKHVRIPAPENAPFIGGKPVVQ